MTKLAAYAFLILLVVLAYWFMVRPLLKARPELQEFYKIEGSWWAAIKLKLDSIKTKLFAALLFIASVVVETHDVLLPMMTNVDFTPITGKVPSQVWPFVSMGIAVAVYWLRKLTEQSETQKLVAVQAGVVTANEVIQGDAEAIAAVKSVPPPPAPEHKPE